MYKFFLPNGKEIDFDSVCEGIENGSVEVHYFLDTKTGKVEVISEFTDNYKEEIERFETDRYIGISYCESFEKYEWMKSFVEHIIEIEDSDLAEKFYIALNGKGAFRRFKDLLYDVGDGWIDAWYSWKDDFVFQEAKQWLESLNIEIKVKLDLPKDCPICRDLMEDFNNNQSN